MLLNLEEGWGETVISWSRKSKASGSQNRTARCASCQEKNG